MMKCTSINQSINQSYNICIFAAESSDVSITTAIPPFPDRSHCPDPLWTVVIVIITVCEQVSEVVFVSNLSLFPSWPLSSCSSLSLINLFNWVESSICSRARFSSFMAHLGKIIIIGWVRPGALKSAGVLLSNSERIIRLLKCALFIYTSYFITYHKNPQLFVITPCRHLYKITFIYLKINSISALLMKPIKCSL